jgi:predicted permease
MFRDLKHAARVLLRSKGWTAVVLLSLALGIGANTALFTAVNGLLLQTVPVPDPDSLVVLKWSGQNDMVRNSSEYGFSRPAAGENVRTTMSYAIYKDMRAANQTLIDLLACAPAGSVNVIVDGAADLASAMGVTGNFFQLLRVSPAEGRLLNDADADPAAPPAAVISEAFWRRRFGGDASAVGRVVTMNGTQTTIVGVVPAGFTSIQRLGAPTPDVTIPLTRMNDTQQLAQPTSWWLQVVGRRKPGVTDEQIRGNFEGVFHASARTGLETAMNALSEKERNLSTNRREGNSVPRLLVLSGRQGIYDLDNSSRRSAGILAVVVGMVLLMVCANVANLLLSRATARRKEITVRLSMGATRSRLIRQLLTESLLLSGIGGLLGLVVGYWARQLLPFGQTVPIDWRVFAFVAGVSLVTGVAFGLVPAFRATRVDLAGTMKDHSRGVIGTRSVLGRVLLVAQVAISLVLLIGAGLFLRTLGNLRAVDVGFDPHNLLVFRVNPQLNRYDAARTALIYRQLQDGLAALPGVRSVALTRTLPLSGSTSSSTVHVRGGPGNNNVYQMTVSPSYFETMNVPLLRGRKFTEHDVKESPRVAILNETAAQKLFPEGNAVGSRLGYSVETSGDIEVVGVVRDTKYSSLRDAAPPTMFSNFVQTSTSQMAVVMRTANDPNRLVEAARGVLRQVDPALPMTGVTTQMDQLEGRFAQERLFATAYSLFGGLALLLACIGLFGVMSYAVSRRTNEIGVRMALGARRVDVIRMVLGESSVMVVIGVVAGLGIAALTVKLAWNQLTPVLFGLRPTDLTAVVVAIVLMVVVATVAGFLPARRASRVDPLAALRVE